MPESNELKTADLNEKEKETYLLCLDVALRLCKKWNIHNFQGIRAIEDEMWGRCSHDGVIYLTFYKYLPNPTMPGGQERWTIMKSEVLRTLAHELAHLVVFNHGPQFWTICNQFIREVSEMTGVKMKLEQNVYRRK